VPGCGIFILKGTVKPIDWDTFQKPAPNKIKFGEEALKRFFRWRCWYDYGTGLSGDLLSHDFDAINQIMGLGIPKYASSSGGIYFYKDGRDVPDVWNATFEYPEKDLTVLYSATLSSNDPRGNRIMGHDATMQMGGQSGGGSVHGFIVKADRESTRYKERWKAALLIHSIRFILIHRGPNKLMVSHLQHPAILPTKGSYIPTEKANELILPIFMLKIGLMQFVAEASQDAISKLLFMRL
jgi:hypothetical protein